MGTRWFRSRATKSAPPADLSIIVPVYNVEDYLDECLTSLTAQDVAAVEIVVVDDGSTDASAKIAARHARRDRRIRVISRANGGLSAARNTGIAAASAPFLTFVDSDDLVQPAGFAAALASLEASGSDFALLPYRRFRDLAAPMPYAPWIADLYAGGQRTLVAHEHPEVLVHATAWSKVYRREFWDRAALAFTEGILYEDQDVSARALVAADRIDIVPEPTYWWRRGRAGSISEAADVRSIGGFLDAARVSLDVLAAVPAAQSARASQYLSNDLPRYLPIVAGFADVEFKDRFISDVAHLQSFAGIDLAAAPVGARVAYALIRSGRGDEAMAAVARGLVDSARQRGDVVDGQPALLTEFASDPDVPAGERILTPANTPLDARVTRAHVQAGRIELTVLTYLRHLDEPLDSLTARWLVDGVPDASFVTSRTEEFVGHRLRTTRRGNESSSWRLSGSLPVSSGRVAAVELTGTWRDRTDVLVVELVDSVGSAGLVQSAAGWTWNPRYAQLVSGSVPGLAPSPAGAATAVEGNSVQVDGEWIALPEAEGDHTVAESVAADLALSLPLDLARGWLGLDRTGRLLWHCQGDRPREELTLWWSRDQR